MAFPSADMEPKTGDGEFKENLNNILICPDCREIPPNLIEEFSSGDMVCGSCGLVVGDRIIDTRSEWRTFSNDDQNGDDPSRVGDGPNLLLEGSQLETTIAREGGKTAKVLANAQNKLSNDKSTKALLSAYREIGTLTDSINAGKTVADAAKHIYKLVEDHKFMKGKPQEAIIAGCIFIACRQNQVPRTFREIFALTRVSKKEIGRVFKQLEAFLAKAQKSGMAGAGLQDAENASNRVATSADVLCGRYCSHLQFKNVQKVEKLSRLLATKAPTRPQLAGRSPLSVAAACIYLASYGLGEPRAPKDIAKIAGVSDGTIKTVYKFMYDIRDDLIEPSWLPAGLSMEKFMEALPAN